MTTADRTRRLPPAVALAIPLIVGAFLRFRGLGRPSLWLDEILGWDLTTAATARPVWHWLTGLEPEHGPLYYATQLLGRIATQPEIAVRLMPAIFGTVAIALVWIAGRYAGGEVTAFCAALILATSPLHVYYSREGRPYSLTMMLTATMLVALLRQSRWLPVVVLAAVYISATAVPVAIAGTIAAFVSAALTPAETARKRMVRAGVFSSAALVLVPILYRGERPPPAPGVDFPALDWSFFDSLFRAFAVTSLSSEQRGRTAAALAVLALVGCVVMIRVNKRRGAVVMAMTILSVMVAIAALSVTGHWYAVRYVSPALPGYVVLAAAGLTGMARLVTSVVRIRPQTVGAAVSLLLTVAVVVQTIPQAMKEPFRKLDWRTIASTIDSHAHDGDLVVAAEAWSAVSLRHYLQRVSSTVRLYEVARPDVAELLVRERQRVWFVTAGYSANTAVREWICLFPVVLASELEGFRIHYAPSIHHFLRDRSTRFEREALAVSYGLDPISIEMGVEDAPLLGAGWSGPEGEEGRFARWATDGRSESIIPVTGRRDRSITMRLMPLEHRALEPQIVRVILNTTELARLKLASGWNEPSIAAPAEAWRDDDGPNLLTLEFARANAPADLDGSSRDHRRLTAMFDRITVSQPGSSIHEPMGRGRSRIVRLQEMKDSGAAAFLDEQTTPGDRRARFPPATLDRSRVESLLARLGYDPSIAWPRLEAGRIHLDDLVAAAALYMPCENDATFVRVVWRLLFERPPNGEEERVLRSLLRSSRSRVLFMRKIVRMDEFRKSIQLQ